MPRTRLLAGHKRAGECYWDERNCLWTVDDFERAPAPRGVAATWIARVAATLRRQLYRPAGTTTTISTLNLMTMRISTTITTMMSAGQTGNAATRTTTSRAAKTASGRRTTSTEPRGYAADESRRRRGRDEDILWRRATPGTWQFVETRAHHRYRCRSSCPDGWACQEDSAGVEPRGSKGGSRRRRGYGVGRGDDAAAAWVVVAPRLRRGSLWRRGHGVGRGEAAATA